MRKLVLWGHNIDDYREMFDLSQDDIQSSRILEFGCGPNAVNSQQTHKNNQIVSCDPLFVLDKDTLASKTSLIFAEMAQEVEKEQEYFDFSRNGSLEQLLAKRQLGLDEFFTDYESGKAQGRYWGVDNYQLPFADFSFDFALSAHYLFAELDEQTVDFHLKIIRELARVAKEVRIFPLIDKEGNASEFLGPVMLGLQKDNYGVEVREVAFHLYKSGNAMLRIWAQQCAV